MRALGMEKKIDGIFPDVFLQIHVIQGSGHFLAIISSLLCGAHQFDLLVISGDYGEVHLSPWLGAWVVVRVHRGQRYSHCLGTIRWF